MVLADAFLRSLQWYVFGTSVVLAAVALKAAFGGLPTNLPNALVPSSNRGTLPAKAGNATDAPAAASCPIPQETVTQGDGAQPDRPEESP